MNQLSYMTFVDLKLNRPNIIQLHIFYPLYKFKII
jgi:hypothetical protein